MPKPRSKRSAEPLAPVLGVGSYTAVEAGRLLKMAPSAVRRWAPQLPAIDDHLELGFRDLMELRFINRMVQAGLGLKTIRTWFATAIEEVNDPRPFSTRRFRTDGRSIFLQTQKKAGGEELINLKNRQYVIREIVERSFKDLDFEGDVVSRWRPFDGKESIVIDPARAFGQPIVDRYGVATTVLAAAVEAEGSIGRAAWAYEMPPSLVRAAAKFEQRLHAA